MNESVRRPEKMKFAGAPLQRKPDRIQVSAPTGPGAFRMKRLVRSPDLPIVGEEAACLKHVAASTSTAAGKAPFVQAHAHHRFDLRDLSRSVAVVIKKLIEQDRIFYPDLDDEIVSPGNRGNPYRLR